MPLGLTEVGYLDKIYFALGANSTAGSEQTTVGSYKWSTVKYTINWVVSWILLCVYRIDQNVQAIAPDVNSLKNNLGYANNYLKAIDTSTKNHRSDFGSAWGYGYGGTSVINKNSPAYWLEWLYNYSFGTYTWPGSTSQSTKGLIDALALISTELYDYDSKMSVGKSNATILSDIRKQWGYGYGGTAVIFNNSPAYWLEWLYKYSFATHTFAGESSSTTKGVAEILWRMDSKLWDTNRSRSVGNIAGDLLAILTAVNERDSRSNAWGYDYSSSSGNYYANSPAGWLNWLYKYSWTTHTFAGDDSQTTRGFSEILWLIDSKLYDTGRGRTIGNTVGDVNAVLDAITKGPEGGRVSFYNIGNSIETIKNETRDLGNLLESIDERVTALDALGVRLANIALTADDIRKSVNSSVQWSEVLHGDLSLLRHGAADLLPGYADWTLWDFLQGIYFDLGQIVDLLKGLQQTLTAWGDRWDSQDLYLMEWAKRWDALDKGGTWSESDKGALFAKLDGISDRLSVEVGQTVLDALLGEVKPQYINDQLTIVKEVARNRFPFCIPAMMQQMLGLMQSEAQVPPWEFDFFGSPLVLDLGDLESFALVTRWASCFMLFLALLANTKRFIFDLGGGGK